MATKQFDAYSDLITFTRASTATYLDSDGLLKSATTNTPRIEYDADGNRLGLLIEEARTNFTTAYAAPTNTTGVTVSNPSGGAGVASVVDDTAALTAAGLQAITGGKVYKLDNSAGTGPSRLVVLGGFDSNNATLSVYARGLTSVTLRTGFGGYPSKSISVSEYTRITTSSSEKNAGSYDVSDVLWVSVEAGETVYVCLPQVELGSFPTSYIPTAGATATRAADVASIPTSAFGYNQKAGTVVVEASGLFPVTGQYVFNLHDTTANEQIYLRFDSTSIGRGVVIDGGSVVFNSDATGSTPSANTFVKYALAAARDNFAVTANGSSPVTDTSGTMPTVTQLALGSREVAGSGYLNGHLKSLKFYPRRLTNTQIQRLTE